MNIAHKTIRAADLDVHYLEAGDGPTLILLHGGTATAESWGDWLPRLAARHHVFAPDTRGHGGTTNPAGRMGYDLFADDTAAFIAALGIDRPLVVGYSDGGQGALELGIRHPRLARALVLGGTVSRPTPAYIDGLTNWGFPAPGEVDEAKLAEVWGDHFGALETMHRNWQDFLRQISRLWLTLPHYSEEHLAAIAAPTLVIMGDSDHMGGPEEALRLFRPLPKGELAILPGMGHEAMEAPMFRDVVEDFLRRHTA